VAGQTSGGAAAIGERSSSSAGSPREARAECAEGSSSAVLT
jgi:hypothetical protein